MATESLRDMRRAKGLSQAQLARAAKVTRVYITQIENGQRTPNPRILKAIADTLGLSLDDAFAMLGKATQEPANG